MKKRTAELILQDPEKFAHHDRVFLNNPVVMQGMGLAPLVVVATTGQNSLMLAVAVALLLVPSRVLACLLSRLVPLRDEEPSPAQLQKKLLPRAILYAASAAVVYLAAYPILNLVFGTGLLNLGIYLPMLVVEPLLTYRFGRVQETVHKAVSKGVRITVGYALLLLVIGMVREWLSLGTVFGAPVVVATTGQNSLMLAVAVALLLVPSRVLACLLSRLVPLRDEEPSPAQLQKKLLPRAILYAASAAVVYLAAYPILNLVFGTGLLNLGIYLPMLVVEPLLTYRFGRVQETVHKAVSKGVRITVGYALLLLVIGMVREWLSLGTVFGAPVGRWALLPLAKMPAGGFIVLGILCAIWRAAAAKRREFLKKEAQDTLTVHYQKEVDREP